MTRARPVRVLVVDDSAFVRKAIRDMLAPSREIEVVGSARDGAEALESIAILEPDVVTLDLHMPAVSGLEVIRALPPDGPRVVVVSVAPSESDLALAALDAGAIDLVRKPTPLATDRIYEMANELVSKVVAAASARPRVARRPPPAARAVAVPQLASHAEIVCIGTSTGGPQALAQLLPVLPAGLPVPIAVVLHIPPGYTDALAARLNAASALSVFEAVDGMVLEPGTIVIAQAGIHLKVRRARGQLIARLDPEPQDVPHRPSVDVLFASAAAAAANRVLGVVLTGMGADGTAGARAIHAAGGRVLAEAESSCVIYGMPRSVKEAGLIDAEAPLEDMAHAIVQRL